MKKIVTIRIEPDIHAKLEQIASEQERSVGFIIRKAIELYLKGKEL